jgi:uncharacterized protein (TIGR02246 family)
MKSDFAGMKEMSMAKKALLGSASMMLALLLAPYAVAADSDVLREAQDRAQIEKLMWRYIRALDTGNAEAYSSAFTPDGQFGSGANASKGREALKKIITDFRQRTAENETKTGVKRPPMYHVIANSSLEFVDKDHARLEAYWMTVSAAGGADNPSRVLGAGREVDELVRLNGQWLIKVRDVAPKD